MCSRFGAGESATFLGVAVHAIGGPGQGFQPLRCDGFAAGPACPKRARLDSAEGALDLSEVQFLALAELLTALTLGNLGGGGGLGAVGHPGMLDFFGKHEADSISLAFERLSRFLDQHRVHSTHRTPLDRVARDDPDRDSGSPGDGGRRWA